MGDNVEAELIQTAVRLPADLLKSIDERRAVGGLSRNAWMVKVFEWALKQPVHTVRVEEKL